MIANRNSLQSKAAVSLEADTRWAVTGTPIQNRLEDLYPIFAFLRLQPLDEFPIFQRLVLIPLRDRDPAALVRIRRLLKVFSLRRTKDQRLNGKPIVMLPTKTIVLKHLRLSTREQVVYDALHARGRSVLGEMVGDASRSVMSQYTRILVLLLRLRQLCNHPALVSNAMDAADPSQLQGWLAGAQGSWDGTAGNNDGDDDEKEQKRGEKLSLEGGARWQSREDLISAVAECCEAIAGESESRAGAGAAGGVKAGEVRLAAIAAGDVACATVSEQDAEEVVLSTCTGMSEETARALVQAASQRSTAWAQSPRLELTPLGRNPPEASTNGEGDALEGGKDAGAGRDVRIDSLLEVLRETVDLPGVAEGAAGVAPGVGNMVLQGSCSKDLPMGDPMFLSTKVEAVLQELQYIESAGSGEKTVVFSQFVRFLDVLERAITSGGRKLCRIDGAVSREGRALAIERFHVDPHCNVLLVTLKTGGMGLNLVAANHVLLTDLWWNGAAEDQAGAGVGAAEEEAGDDPRSDES
ncbi:P-loop containing nucleoside triphosphate hydrolase protein [Baffinella frigidus]|nr:P-loop containing nucleoside triphosphate hydrolase protein [Cryptophyta sp. CCMP2293]